MYTDTTKIQEPNNRVTRWQYLVESLIPQTDHTLNHRQLTRPRAMATSVDMASVPSWGRGEKRAEGRGGSPVNMEERGERSDNMRRKIGLPTNRVGRSGRRPVNTEVGGWISS